MNSFKKAAILLVATLILAPSFAHAKYDYKTLFQKKAWKVLLTHNTQTGKIWCSAETRNRSGQLFALNVFPGKVLSMQIYDPAWRLEDRNVDFILDVDYNRWYMTGDAHDASVFVDLAGTQKTTNFLKQVIKGNAVALYNKDVRRLAIFSLGGSSAALRALLECANKIDPSDPFGPSVSNPF